MSPANSYFRLQIKRINREFRAFGISPFFAYPLIGIAFLFLSELLFQKTSFAPYIYTFFALYTSAFLSDFEKNDFLKRLFKRVEYQKIRLLENCFFIFPFVWFLIYKEAYLMSVILFAGSIALSFLNQIRLHIRTIPTPFGRFPFEFPIGFRKYFLLFPFALLLFFIALGVGNFNLALFSIALIFFVMMGFYADPEPLHYIQVFAMKRQRFLLEKIKTVSIYSQLFTLPLALILAFLYPSNLWIIASIQLAGIGLILITLLAKYASYPSTINLLQGFALGACIFFPPLMVVVLPYLYQKAMRNEKIQLNVKDTITS